MVPDIVDDPIDADLADDGRKFVAGCPVGKIELMQAVGKLIGRVAGDANHVVTLFRNAVCQGKTDALLAPVIRKVLFIG